MIIIENKYGNKIYFEYEIIIAARNMKPKAINRPVEAKFSHSLFIPGTVNASTLHCV